MKSSYWRHGVATLLTAGLLATGAAAQDGAEGEVNIQDQAPTETAQPEEQPAANDKPIKPQIVDRDPFVNQLMTGNVLASSAPSRGGSRIKARADGEEGEELEDDLADDEMLDDEGNVVEVPAPEVTVNGIVMSGSGHQAIISTGNGTQMIRQGQSLGDYRVSRITQKSVTFTYGGEKDFEVPLEAEF